MGWGWGVFAQCNTLAWVGGGMCFFIIYNSHACICVGGGWGVFNRPAVVLK